MLIFFQKETKLNQEYQLTTLHHCRPNRPSHQHAENPPAMSPCLPKETRQANEMILPWIVYFANYQSKILLLYIALNGWNDELFILLTYMQEFQHSDWLRACQLIPDSTENRN